MILRRISTLFASFAFIAFACCESLTIHSQSIGDKKAPSPLLKISFDAATLTANVTSYLPPSAPYSDESRIRIGLYETSGPTAGSWTSAVYTTGRSFDEKYQKRFQLYVDDNGAVWNVGFSSSLRGPEDAPKEKSTGGKSTQRTNNNKKEKAPKELKEDVVVEVVKKARGPSAFLNKPVVLGADGKVEQKEPEKTLFQKYWWVLALFLLLNVAVGGGGGEK